MSILYFRFLPFVAFSKIAGRLWQSSCDKYLFYTLSVAGRDFRELFV